MLTKHEAATIRAALRFWIDEIVPHRQSTAGPYFDADGIERLDRTDVESIIERFQESQLRFAEINSERLMTRAQAEHAANVDKIQTVIAVARSM